MNTSSRNPPHLDQVAEREPGVRWQAQFARAWPAYRAWLAGLGWHGAGGAGGAGVGRRRLAVEFPELLPTYEKLCELAGDDELAHQFLTLYRPPPFLLGCSALALSAPEPLLVRNYDYSPELWERTAWSSCWRRPVAAMSDCLWGALDGVNADGLAVALAFGGRRVVGDGFAIPLLVRFLLETCATVEECRQAAPRLRSHMAYSLLAVDATGDRQAIHLAPDRAPVFDPRPVLSNFQGHPEWPEHARATRAVERFQAAEALHDSAPSARRVVAAFRRAPLVATDFDHSFGTLYTAAYSPRSAAAHWIVGGNSFRLTANHEPA